MSDSIDVISWKANQLGTTYGKLHPEMKPGDLEQYTKEYEEAQKAEWAMLREASKQRKAKREQ